ncbi:MAG: hypothetical protein EP330_09560 [Deltaproteobacteria bacterium]|nr:MAG: hypothetical protein EP330_09560 [Deltaproteobacteria bacterium]
MSVIGLRVGPFEIEREAHVPVSGTWYVAHRTGTTRRRPTHVLVKLLTPDASQADRTALQAEYDALRAVDDSRVPKAVGYYEGTGALVIEAAGGAPLTALVARRSHGELPMTPATLCDLGLDLSECLQHAHHKGRHHGHLEPGQLWLSAEGRLWVWGFGENTPPETPWLPPERARGLPTSAATDQWSLGALLAALITGRAPWTTEEEARRGSCDTHVDNIEVQWPALGRLLRRMLDPEPARRFPDLGPVRQELLALSRKAGGLSERRELAISLADLAAEAFTEAPSFAEESPQTLEITTSPTSTLATEDDVTVRQPPPPQADGVHLAEAEARELPMGRLASPGTLADEAIPVVGPELTEDVPAAVVGEQSKETQMSGKPDDPSGASDVPVVPDPADADTTRMKPAEPTMDDYAEDDDEIDEEATLVVDSEAVQRAIAEARALASNTASANDDETADTAPPAENRQHAPSIDEEATGSQPEAVGGPATNPTAVPWTDNGGEYGGSTPAANAPVPDEKVVLPEDGELPQPHEPRGMPQNQRLALGAVALMVLAFLLVVVLNM